MPIPLVRADAVVSYDLGDAEKLAKRQAMERVRATVRAEQLVCARTGAGGATAARNLKFGGRAGGLVAVSESDAVARPDVDAGDHPDDGGDPDDGVGLDAGTADRKKKVPMA